jgi:hypothetical protein
VHEPNLLCDLPVCTDDGTFQPLQVLQRQVVSGTPPLGHLRSRCQLRP